MTFSSTNSQEEPPSKAYVLHEAGAPVHLGVWSSQPALCDADKRVLTPRGEDVDVAGRREDGRQR